MKRIPNLSACLRSRAGRLVATTALAAALLLLPGAATPAQAGHGHHGHAARHHHHHHHGHHSHGPVVAYGVAPRPTYAPIRVRYYRPAVAPAFYYLPSPYVVVHGPSVRASVVAYPASAPVIYEDGYCPRSVHYHAHRPAPAVHGSLSVRVGF